MSQLNQRERLTIVLVMFVIKMLQPLRYSHQLDEFFATVRKELDA